MGPSGLQTYKATPAVTASAEPVADGEATRHTDVPVAFVERGAVNMAVQMPEARMRTSLRGGQPETIFDWRERTRTIRLAAPFSTAEHRCDVAAPLALHQEQRAQKAPHR